jgi:hypothetical protein
MGDVLEYTANAGNVFDIQNRIIANQERMGGSFVKSASHTEASWLRSDRAVGRASANLVGNLLQVNSASDAAAVALQSIERGTHFGLAAAIGIGVAVKAYEILSKQIEATHAAETALDKDISRPKQFVLGQSTGGLEKDAERLRKEIEEVERQQNSPTQRVLDVLKFGPLESQREPIEAERSAKKAEAQARLRDIQEQIGKNAIAEADLGDRSLYTTEREVELKKNQVEAEQKIAGIRAGLGDNPDPATSKKIAAIKQVEQQKADKINLKGDLEEIGLSEAAEKSVVTGSKEEQQRQDLLITYQAELKTLERIDALHGSANEKTKAQIELQNTSNKIRDRAKTDLQNPQQSQARERAAREADNAFDAKVQYFLDQTKRGVKFDKDDPTAKIIKDFLDNGGKTKDGQNFTGIDALADKDFTNISDLASLDFQNLKPLTDLKITVAH